MKKNIESNNYVFFLCYSLRQGTSRLYARQ